MFIFLEHLANYLHIFGRWQYTEENNVNEKWMKSDCNLPVPVSNI